MRLCRGKRPRGARPNQVLVALFLPLVMTQSVVMRCGETTGIFNRLPRAEIDAKRGCKAGISVIRIV